MKFEDLLELNADELEKLTDEQLREYLSPCLKDCKPIDIQIVEQEEAKIKAEKDAKKLLEKEKKKLEKEKLKAQVITTEDKTKIQKESKKVKAQSMMDMLKALNAQMALMTPKDETKKEIQS